MMPKMVPRVMNAVMSGGGGGVGIIDGIDVGSDVVGIPVGSPVGSPVGTRYVTTFSSMVVRLEASKVPWVSAVTPAKAARVMISLWRLPEDTASLTRFWKVFLHAVLLALS